MAYRSSLKLTSAIPLEKEEIKKARQIIQSLIDSPDSPEFRNPVDWKGLNLPDYPVIIKDPMDLSTVSTKLTNETYQYVEELLDDIQQIWDNCKTYNLKGMWIYSLAEKLEKLFKKLLKNYFPMVQMVNCKSVPSAKAVVEPKPKNLLSKDSATVKAIGKNNSTDNTSNIGMVASRSLGVFQAQPPKQADQSSAKPPLMKARKQAKFDKLYYEDEQEISKQEKMKLAEQLREFPEQNLQYVVDFICEICPAAFQEIEDDKVQIIVSNMDVITFRQVMEKVQEEMSEFKGGPKHVKQQ